jgi:lipoate-protein ligase A
LDKAAARGGSWRVVHERGSAAALHAGAARALNQSPVPRMVRFVTADPPALVLGSHQREEVFDRGALEAAGLEVARRRSGGSAVLVGGGRVLWVDFTIPAGDPLWADDVGRAAWWVGEAWAAAIGEGDVWTGPMRRRPWSEAVCFAGLGPGEVTIEGRKVVGVSQRRTRRGALFQTAAVLDWRPEEYAALMLDPPGAADELAAAARGLGVQAADRLESALMAHLMS